jgi:predicted phage terminase large subunit-like protein
MSLTAEQVHGFTQAVLLSHFDDPKPTPAIHLEWWKLMCSKDKYVAIAAPRGHAKSTAVTHSFVLAALLFRYRDYIIIVSDTEGQATQFLGDIKSELLNNEELIRLFGVKRLIKDTETDIVVEFSDGHRAKVSTKGSEQKLRGLKWNNKRPNMIVGDDLENDELVMNEERREKFRRWFFNALIPAGSDDCIVRIVGTILHLDALLERLMPQIGDKYTVDEPLRSYSTDPTREWRAVRYRAHDEDFSHILWPEKFSKERLESIRRLFTEQGFPEGYSQEYLNYPIDEATSYFRKADFLPILDMDEPLEYYAAADLAISEKDRSAFTVMIVAGLSSKGILKTVDVRRFRGDALDIINEMFSIQQRYNPALFIIERENIARSIGSVLRREMIARNIFISIHEEVPTQDKTRRARAIQARMRAGQVEFDIEADWFPDLQNEFITFPRGRYKDQVDALAWIGLVLDKMVEAPTYEQLLEEDFELTMSEDLEFDDGTNWMTGY